MTKSEAHEILKQVLHSVRDKNVYEALKIANKALAWECAYEKTLGITVEPEMEKINET